MNEVLVVMVLVWAGVLLPDVLRSRNASPYATVGRFQRAMDVLRNGAHGASGGRRVLVPGDAGRIVEHPEPIGEPGRLHRPRGSDPVVARRLSWFRRCLVATGVTLLVALIAGGILWLPFALSAGLTAVYVAVLRHLKLQRDEARQVVSDLDIYIDVAAEERDIALDTEDWIGSGTVRLRRWND